HQGALLRQPQDDQSVRHRTDRARYRLLAPARPRPLVLSGAGPSETPLGPTLASLEAGSTARARAAAPSARGGRGSAAAARRPRARSVSTGGSDEQPIDDAGGRDDGRRR